VAVTSLICVVFSSFGDRVYSLWLVIFCVSIGVFLLLTLCLVIFCVSIGCFCVFSILCASIGYLFRTCVLGADHGSSRVILLSSKYYFSRTTSFVANKRTKSKVLNFFL